MKRRLLAIAMVALVLTPVLTVSARAPSTQGDSSRTSFHANVSRATAAVLEDTPSGVIGPTALGDAMADTVYTPLPNGRCRVADSRVINSPLPGGASRQINTEGVSSFASQGGSGSGAGDGSANCGIPEGTAALAVSVTVLSSGQEGVFKIYPNGVNYTQGNTVYYTSIVSTANDVMVKSCQSCDFELQIYSSANVHYVLDVVGYFMRPAATALECIETSPEAPGASMTLSASGGVGDVYSAECNADIGFEQTAINCRTSSPDAFLVFMGNRVCSAKNTGTSNATLQATATCCRVPGTWSLHLTEAP